MELRDWIGLVVVLAPLWIGLGYGLLRLIRRIPPPEGVPPGRRGGAGRVRPGGVPVGDAPHYAQKLKRDEEKARRKREEAEPEDGSVSRRTPPAR